MTLWQWFGISVIALLCAILPWLLWREEHRRFGREGRQHRGRLSRARHSYVGAGSTEKPDRRAALILAGLALFEGIWVVANFVAHPLGFVRYMGFTADRLAQPLGWFAGLLVAVIYVLASARLPSVRTTLFQVSPLKILALLLAVVAGILEEVVFRKMLMDYVHQHGFGDVAQVVLSGMAFGLAHAIWGILGRSVRAAVGAMLATGVLGAMLGMVYVAAGRNVGPCIAAHFLINAMIEPGLVLAAGRGEFGRRPL